MIITIHHSGYITIQRNILFETQHLTFKIEIVKEYITLHILSY